MKFLQRTAVLLFSSSITSVLAAPLPSASPRDGASIQARDASGVYDGISAIDASVRKLTATLTAYQGGIRAAQPVLDASLAVHAANREANAVALASNGTFSSADSKRIVDHVNDSVGVSIPESVKVLEAKKPLFDAALLSQVIEASINTLKLDHETYSAAVGEHLSPDQLGPGLAAAGKIDAVLQGASLYYAV